MAPVALRRRPKRLPAIIQRCTLVLAVLALWSTPAAAHEDPAPPGGTAEQEAAAQGLELPVPPPDAVYGGPKLVVRTDLVNTTQYLIYRHDLVELGFADALESAPGSFLVPIGDLTFEEAVAKIETLDHTVEVLPAYGFDGEMGGQGDALALPAWWMFAALSIPAAAFAVALTRRSTAS